MKNYETFDVLSLLTLSFVACLTIVGIPVGLYIIWKVLRDEKI